MSSESPVHSTCTEFFTARDDSSKSADNPSRANDADYNYMTRLLSEVDFLAVELRNSRPSQTPSKDSQFRSSPLQEQESDRDSTTDEFELQVSHSSPKQCQRLTNVSKPSSKWSDRLNQADRGWINIRDYTSAPGTSSMITNEKGDEEDDEQDDVIVVSVMKPSQSEKTGPTRNGALKKRLDGSQPLDNFRAHKSRAKKLHNGHTLIDHEGSTESDDPNEPMEPMPSSADKPGTSRRQDNEENAPSSTWLQSRSRAEKSTSNPDRNTRRLPRVRRDYNECSDEENIQRIKLVPDKSLGLDTITLRQAGPGDVAPLMISSSEELSEPESLANDVNLRSNGKLEGPRGSEAGGSRRQPGRKYTERERKQMIDYLIENHRIDDAMGLQVWKDMARDLEWESRTYQSMNNHFRRQLLPQIYNYEMSEKDRKYFERRARKSGIKILPKGHINRRT